MTYMSDLPIDAAKKNLRTEEGNDFWKPERTFNLFTPEVQQPQCLDGLFVFFPRGKQCPKHWQADRFKGIVQKLWVGSHWQIREISTFVGWVFGVSLFPAIGQIFLNVFKWLFVFWILNIIRCHIIFVYFISFPALYIVKKKPWKATVSPTAGIHSTQPAGTFSSDMAPIRNWGHQSLQVSNCKCLKSISTNQIWTFPEIVKLQFNRDELQFHFYFWWFVTHVLHRTHPQGWFF